MSPFDQEVGVQLALGRTGPFDFLRAPHENDAAGLSSYPHTFNTIINITNLEPGRVEKRRIPALYKNLHVPNT